MDHATSTPSSAFAEPDPGYKWRVLASVVVGLFMVILDFDVDDMYRFVKLPPSCE